MKAANFQGHGHSPDLIAFKGGRSLFANRSMLFKKQENSCTCTRPHLVRTGARTQNSFDRPAAPPESAPHDRNSCRRPFVLHSPVSTDGELTVPAGC
jgi:hypothetical protein